MTKRLFSLRFLISSVLKNFFRLTFIAGVLQGCNDNPYQIGLDLLPTGDLIKVKQQDSLIVETYTTGPLPIPVYDSLNLPFGTYYDAVFGKTSAGLMFELSPANNYKRIYPGIVVDSVILNMYYDTIYGDFLYVPQIGVYELTEGISKTTRYYSGYDITGKISGSNLNHNATIVPDTTRRFKLLLDNELGLDLLTTEGMNDSLLFAKGKIDSVFDQNFKGLYLDPPPESDEGGIVNFYYINMTVKFHTDIDTTAISFFFYPNYTGVAAIDSTSYYQLGDKFIKIFEHDYSGTPITHLNDSTFQDTAIYLQSLGGTQAVLNIRLLDQLRAQIGNVSVNNAELFIPVLGDSAEFYGNYPPAQLGIRVLDDVSIYVPDDMLYKPNSYTPLLSFIDGRFDRSAWSYRFFLTSYFQEYMKGNRNSGRFQIFAGQNGVYLNRTNYNPDFYNRVILAGSGNPNHKITFKIAYTKLPESQTE